MFLQVSDMKALSIRNKVLGVLLIPTMLTMILVSALVYFGARQTLEEELGLRLALVGQTLSSEFSGGVEAAQIARLDESKVRTRQQLKDRLNEVKKSTGVRRVFVMDRDFQSLVDTEDGVEFHQRLFAFDADRFEVESALNALEPSSSVLFRGDDGTMYKTSYVPVILEEDGQDSQAVAVIGVMASASFFELLNGLASSFILLGVVGNLFMILVGVLFSRRLTRPIFNLVEAAHRLERGDFQEPVLTAEQVKSSSHGDEIDRLAVAFERMRGAVLDRDGQMQMMLSGIAHEVRNPLGGMELFCGLLREDLEEDTPVDEDRLRKVHRIERELTYLNRVVTNFLDFARHRQLDMERFGAEDFLSEVNMLLCAEVEGVGCALQQRIEPENVELTGDREKLRRALINIVRNAWQASPDGGKIEMSVTLVEPDNPEQSARRIVVEDHGEGIDPDKIEEILTPFFTTREKGSGLGLAMTKKIVEQHGGEFLIESVKGEGTRMIFVLPFDPSLEVEVQEQSIPEGWLG